MVNQKLLIIDDSPDIRELVIIWLSQESLDFAGSASGVEGIQEAQRYSPDLILLDVDLPDIDGFEVCRSLKADPATSSIPIIFLTGASSTDEKLRGLELGATDYVTKPFDPAELRARVRAALHTRRLMELLAQKAVILQESEERFRVLAENSSDVISRHTPAGVFLYASPAAATILGYAPEQLVGRDLVDFVHPEDAEAVRICRGQPQTSGATRTLSFRFLRGDGHHVWLESTCRILSDLTTGAIRELHASTRDISLRKQMEFREQIRAQVLGMIAQENPLGDILHQLIAATEQLEPHTTAAGVMLNAGVVHHCAPSLPRGIALAIERQMHTLLSRLGALGAESHDRIICCDLSTDPAFEELRPVMLEHRLRSCWSILIISRHRDAAGAFSIYCRDDQRPSSSTLELMKLASELIGVAVEHRELTDQLTFQARHDALTSLPNRILFADRLQQAMANSGRSRKSGAVIVVDIDRFKHINDTYGHQAGDELLCQVAQRLGSRLRKSDTLARMGGDEFAIILSELAAPVDAELVSKLLIEAFAAPIDLRGRDFFVSVSMGSAIYLSDGTDPTTLLKHADIALYRAKEAGRNTCRAFTRDMSEGAVERLELESELRQAVSNHQLQLLYQPQVDFSGNILGLEALLRWNHPDLGTIPPAKFIPLAEDSGLILPIGVWVLEEAARQTREWILAGIEPVPVSVNISMLQFTQPNFITTILQALEIADSPHPWLQIELTESMLMRNMTSAADKLAHLRDMDVQVAVDDFGTGYSSLAYLQRLPIDSLKIDHSFILATESERNRNSGRTIITAIISIAKSLGLSVIAEGVETESQRQFLEQLGCDLMQGFLFSHPQPAAKIEPMLRSRAPVVLKPFSGLVASATTKVMAMP